VGRGYIAQQGPAFAQELRRFRIANTHYRRLKAFVSHGPLQTLKNCLALTQQMGLETAARSFLTGTPLLVDHPSQTSIAAVPDKTLHTTP